MHCVFQVVFNLMSLFKKASLCASGMRIFIALCLYLHREFQGKKSFSCSIISSWLSASLIDTCGILSHRTREMFLPLWLVLASAAWGCSILQIPPNAICHFGQELQSVCCMKIGSMLQITQTNLKNIKRFGWTWGTKQVKHHLLSFLNLFQTGEEFRVGLKRPVILSYFGGWVFF